MITYSMGLWLWLVALEIIVRQSWHVKLNDFQVGYKTRCSNKEKKSFHQQLWCIQGVKHKDELTIS